MSRKENRFHCQCQQETMKYNSPRHRTESQSRGHNHGGESRRCCMIIEMAFFIFIQWPRSNASSFFPVKGTAQALQMDKTKFS